MTKWVAMEFASPKIWIKDHIKDITEAYEHARWYLHYRNKLETHLHCANDRVYIGFVDPPENFNYAQHLRGIAIYLLEKNPEYYRPHMTVNRMFYYKEVSEDDSSTID